jgi:hypothetical protein
MFSEIQFFFDALKLSDGQTRRQMGEGRQLLASACESFPVDRMIFQRGADGKVISATFGDGIGCPPAVAIGMGNGYLSLLGIGPYGVGLVAANAKIIGTALAQKLEQPYRFHHQSGECVLSASRSGVYRIPRMSVISMGKLRRRVVNDYLAGGRYTLESVGPLIRKGIINGIVGQARRLDETCGGHLESAIGSDDMLDVRVLEGGVTIAPVKDGLCALIATNLVVSMNLDLHGAWLAGGMRSYGLGRIYRGNF